MIFRITERRFMIMGVDSSISLATIVLGMGTVAYGARLNLSRSRFDQTLPCIGGSIGDGTLGARNPKTRH